MHLTSSCCSRARGTSIFPYPWRTGSWWTLSAQLAMSQARRSSFSAMTTSPAMYTPPTWFSARKSDPGTVLPLSSTDTCTATSSVDYAPPARRITPSPSSHPSGKQAEGPGVKVELPAGRTTFAAGVPLIRVHDTRHTCASLLAALDVHPRVAMQILRHSQISLTMNIYTQPRDTQSARPSQHQPGYVKRSFRTALSEGAPWLSLERLHHFSSSAPSGQSSLILRATSDLAVWTSQEVLSKARRRRSGVDEPALRPSASPSTSAIGTPAIEETALLYNTAVRRSQRSSRIFPKGL